MRQVTVPLRDFAVPIPRTGNLEPYSGYGRATADGQEIHLAVQKKRAKADPSYQSEVPISGRFDRGGFSFRVEGRIDGLFLHDLPRIEEIKTSFFLNDLARRLAGSPMEHPYCLQLLTYGYLWWRQHDILPELSFHLVSSRTREWQDMLLPLDLQRYEAWLDTRLECLVEEARIAEKRSARRRKTASKLPFPFAVPRPGQTELMQTVEQGMLLGKTVLIQAPTGMGKTVGVLYPVLKEALGRGQNVIYVTPKNSQHSVVEDAVSRFQQAGANLRALSITAKAKLCFKNEPLCTPEYCEFALQYHDKFHQHGIGAILRKKRALKRRSFRSLGEKYGVCPFELQFEAVSGADIIICDYNYVFAPRSALSATDCMEIDQSGKPSLVIDEAHNLPVRSMDYYSPALSSLVLEKMREEIRKLPVRFRREGDALLDQSIAVLASCRPDRRSGPAMIDMPVQKFLEQDLLLRSFLSRYLESDIDIIRDDVVLRLSFYWSSFTETLGYAADAERQEFFTTFHPDQHGGTVKITCCDASDLIKDCYSHFSHVVAFSATLKPFEYYSRLSGIPYDRVMVAEFTSPFPRERRKVILIPQISTRYSQRERNYGKIADAIARIVSLRRGNYLVFLPSFQFLERVLQSFHVPLGFDVLRQEKGMLAGEIEAVLDLLRQRTVPAIVFAVQGGSFSEGVDYLGDMVIGAFVVGPPLPTYDLEREEMRAYYQRQYGKGASYAYTIPAMAKAVQAAGRVIRSETDRGLIVLMDSRFIEPEYTEAMPADWFDSDVTELVSDSILRDISHFWLQSPR